VKIDRALADRTTAGEGHAGAPVPSEQRPEDEHRSAHGPDQVVGRLERLKARDLDGGCAIAPVIHFGAELLENEQHGAHVAHPGKVGQLDSVLGQQGRGERGEGRVLGARDGNAAFQTTATRDAQFIHGGSR